MDLLMIVLPAASVIGSILFAVSKLKKSFGIKVDGGSNQMLGPGNEKEKEKAKVLEKEPVQNPDVMGPTSYNMTAQGYGMGEMGPAMMGGLGMTNIVGAVNGIGGIMQSGNVKNSFIATNQKTGDFKEEGQNIFNKKLKGVKTLEQTGTRLFNTTTHGKITMNQGQNAQSRISNGKVNINPLNNASNYIYGNVRRLRSVGGNVYTKQLKIRGISKAQTLFTKTFSGPIGTMNKMQHLATGSRYGLNSAMAGTQGVLPGAPNVGLTLNDIKFSQVLVGYHSKGRYSAKDPKQQLKMIEMQEVYGDKENMALTPEQKKEFYVITRTQKNARMVATGNGISAIAAESGSRYRNDLIREVIEMAPQLTRKQKIQVINKAMEMKKARRRDQQLTQQALAAERTNQKINVNQENQKALDELLRDTSAVATNFNNFIDENFDNIHNLSEEEIKRIEDQARENVRRRDDLTLEEKEQEYERLKEEMQTDTLESRLEEIEGIVKDEILDNPSEAKEILGDKGVELLTEKLAKIQSERDALYQKMLKVQRKSSASSWEEFKRRRDEEMKNDIQNAIQEVTSSEGNASIIPFVSRQAQESELERKQIG